ncbi:beta-glucoside bgl operon antiterminator [Klebsiella grimontii]|uniref:Beta-glucoside bgl operon antiterminator n=1 Tax=Klebsiella grimontii TaxID=2058152 RepID=A0A7H4P8G0_9ENTR|nr:beta-glucoside bgl operon antiterminator [Klebsiella grimontii]
MIVQKVLNNSLVLSMDDDSREVIVMGKGIGFNSRPGDEIAPEKIEKAVRDPGARRAQRLS